MNQRMVCPTASILTKSLFWICNSRCYVLSLNMRNKAVCLNAIYSFTDGGVYKYRASVNSVGLAADITFDNPWLHLILFE